MPAPTSCIGGNTSHCHSIGSSSVKTSSPAPTPFARPTRGNLPSIPRERPKIDHTIRYEKPAELLEPVPAEGFQMLSDLSLTEHIPSGGMWRLELQGLEWESSDRYGFFDPSDFVRFLFLSSPIDLPYIASKDISPSDPHWQLSLGPLRLSDFSSSLAFECPIFVPSILYKSPLFVTMVAATKSPVDGKDVVLARAKLMLNSKRDPGYTQEGKIWLQTQPPNHIEFHSGIRILYKATLLAIDRCLHPAFNMLLQLAAPFPPVGDKPKHVAILSGPASNGHFLRVLFDRFGKATVLGKQTSNDYPKDMSMYALPAQYGRFTGSDYAHGKSLRSEPLATLFSLMGCTYCLPRLPDRTVSFPNLRLYADKRPLRGQEGRARIELALSLDEKDIPLKGTWEEAYVFANDQFPSSWPADANLDSITSPINAKLDESAGLWIDVAQRFMVVYHPALSSPYKVSELLICLPIEDHHLPSFSALPQPTLLAQI